VPIFSPSSKKNILLSSRSAWQKCLQLLATVTSGQVWSACRSVGTYEPVLCQFHSARWQNVWSRNTCQSRAAENLQIHQYNTNIIIIIKGLILMNCNSPFHAAHIKTQYVDMCFHNIVYTAIHFYWYSFSTAKWLHIWTSFYIIRSSRKCSKG